MLAWIVQCTTCPWVARAADINMTHRTGEVHEYLHRGHVVSDVKEDGEWVR